MAEDRLDRLFDASRRGDAQEVEEVLRAQPELLEVQDHWGLTPLHSAAVAGHTHVLALLLEYQANVDGNSRSGQTALHFACREGREDAVRELLRRRADVSRRTAHGILPLELALPGCDELIRQEAQRRIQVAEQDVAILEDQLRRAVQAKELLEAQLVEDPRNKLDAFSGTGTSEAEEGACSGPMPLHEARLQLSQAARVLDDPEESYWRRAGAWLAVQRCRGRAALMGAFMRIPTADQLSVAVLDGPVLPVLDPEDDGLPAARAKLALVTREKLKRQQAKSAFHSRALEEDAVLEEEILGLVMEQAMDEGTGRTPQEWQELVEALGQPDATWDWSRLEVLPAPCPRNQVAVELGVFAVDPAPPPEDEEEPPPPKVIFEEGEIIGPVGGVLRRKSRYMEEHYGKELWMFHDPMAEELRLRIQVTELRTEPMVVDLRSGNCLRHLRDIRADPLGMSELLPEVPVPASPSGVFPNGRKRTARISSRPPSAEEQPSPPGSPSSMASPASRASPNSRPMTGRTDRTEASGLEVPSIREATVRVVEVHCHGWPYSFVVASRDIYAGEELALDRGEEFWLKQRAAVERLTSIAPAMEEMLLGVTLPEPQPPNPADAFPPRRPHMRPASKPSQRG